jgi:nicotinamide mononucleotide transporter
MTFDVSQLFVTKWEFIGFITGILSVALLIPTKHPRLQWTNWIASIVSAAVYTFIFYDYELYANSGLQVYFVIISLQGAWMWRNQLRKYASGEIDAKAIPITWGPFETIRNVLLFFIGCGFFVIPLLAWVGDSNPFWDGLMVCLSGAAIYLQLKKYVESWYVWITVDLIAIPLHATNGLGATAVLYGLYMAMCFIGLRTWWNEADKDRGATIDVALA